MTDRGNVDFKDYDLSGVPVDYRYGYDAALHEVVCVACGDTYGLHYGDDNERAKCGSYTNPTGLFIPNLPLKRDKLLLPDELFEVC